MRHNKNENFFSKPSVLNSYWAGFIAADGCITDKTRLYIGLNLIDICILKRFLKDVEYPEIIITRKTVRNNTICEHCQINIRSKQWILDLNKHWNITPRKSLTLQPPNLTELEHKLAYIIGYIDGDGHISYKDNYFRIHICGNYDIILYIANILFSLEDIIKYKKPLSVLKKNNSDCYYIQCTHRRAKEILKQLYKYKTPFRLQRKWKHVNKYLSTST